MGWQWPFHWPSGSGGKSEGAEGASDLQPVLLIPGIGGSILNAVANDGSAERIWVRLLLADHEFRLKLWSKYNPDTARSESLCKDSKIMVPEDNFGLYSCDILDPSLNVPVDAICYYHYMILEMRKWGFKDGETLFGFGYDFRQSNRLAETMDRLLLKLKSIHESTGKKVDVITHSMGGMVFKSFLALHHDDVAAHVNKWVSIASPFRGAPGFIMDTLLTGVEFLKGWQKSLFIAKWSMHQLLVECPSVYELMTDYSFDWKEIPELRLVQQTMPNGTSGDVVVEERRLKEEAAILQFMERVLQDNKVELNGETIPLPLNRDILEWAKKTRDIWKMAKLPDSVDLFVIYGTSLDTPLHCRYGSKADPLKDPHDVLHTEAAFGCVDGDGTVPVQSALGGGLPARFHVGVPGEHRALLNDPRVYRLLQFFLRIGPYDELYDPYTDCVLVPSKSEVEKSMLMSMVMDERKKLEETFRDVGNVSELDVNVRMKIRKGQTQETVEIVEVSLSVMPELGEGLLDTKKKVSV